MRRGHDRFDPFLGRDAAELDGFIPRARTIVDAGKAVMVEVDHFLSAKRRVRGEACRMAPLIRRFAAPSPRKRGEGPPAWPLIRRFAAPSPRTPGRRIFQGQPTLRAVAAAGWRCGGLRCRSS